ncbi:MAG: methionine ABC transporter ATP-binding protein [Parachlamydiales bacterium]|nr:methionine ABC transporter ATP-binding protein [Parachlamydiales bacterium]
MTQHAQCSVPVVLHIQNLSKYYPNQAHPALDNINLKIEQGDVYGMIGYSGAGKSTLMRCICQLEFPSSGSLFLDNQPIKSVNNFFKKIGVVFQHFNLFPSRTVFENVVFPLEIAKVPVQERKQSAQIWLERVGLWHKRDAYPSSLSGGEKQRVGLARALVTNPDLLLCDEATSALDPQTTSELLQLLLDCNQKYGLTLLVITHEMGVVKRLCNKVAVMEAGKIVEQGLVSDLFYAPKHPTTKKLLHLGVDDLKDFVDRKNLYRLSFVGDRVKEPVISTLMRDFNLTVNILLGTIDSLKNGLIGHLMVELLGDDSDVKKALNYLYEKGVAFEEVIL